MLLESASALTPAGVAETFCSSPPGLASQAPFVKPPQSLSASAAALLHSLSVRLSASGLRAHPASVVAARRHYGSATQAHPV
jgi:hypothetical protein